MVTHVVDYMLCICYAFAIIFIHYIYIFTHYIFTFNLYIIILYYPISYFSPKKKKKVQLNMVKFID